MQSSGPSLSEEEVSRLRDLLESSRGVPSSTVSAQGHFLRGNAYHETAEYQSAVDEYSEAIRLNPEIAPAYSNRGNAYAELGRDERAIEDYDEAIRRDPELAPAYSNRAVSYRALGKDEEAQADFDRAAELGFVPDAPEDASGGTDPAQ